MSDADTILDREAVLAINADRLFHRAGVEAAQRKLDAVALLIGKEKLEEILAGRVTLVPVAEAGAGAMPKDDLIPWTDWIVAVVKQVGGRSTYKELQSFARNEPAMRDRFAKTPNGFYNAVKRLVGRKELHRNGTVLTTPEYEAARQKETAHSSDQEEWAVTS